MTASHSSPTFIRDELAVDRTVLANERTVLAYLRTSITFVAGGFSLLHFFTEPGLFMLGWLLVGTAVFFFGVGLWRYTLMRASLRCRQAELLR
ncbi:MAG: DUF202 domain-containing protein [Candidatus Peribacteraceae bacterium]|nr:DUF202 domain-containing protein [Candidatus Peribacteraceae bacterium]